MPTPISSLVLHNQQQVKHSSFNTIRLLDRHQPNSLCSIGRILSSRFRLDTNILSPKPRLCWQYTGRFENSYCYCLTCRYRWDNRNNWSTRCDWYYGYQRLFSQSWLLTASCRDAIAVKLLPATGCKSVKLSILPLGAIIRSLPVLSRHSISPLGNQPNIPVGSTVAAGNVSPAGIQGPQGQYVAVVQAAHGFLTGDPVYWSGSSYALAEANAANTLGIGIVSVIDAILRSLSSRFLVWCQWIFRRAILLRFGYDSWCIDQSNRRISIATQTRYSMR